jgi:hypothetical protein
VFTDAEHFDYLYLYEPKLPCRQTKGPCRYVGPATDHLVAMFFAKYLPPELWPNMPGLIPDNLVPPRCSSPQCRSSTPLGILLA